MCRRDAVVRARHVYRRIHGPQADCAASPLPAPRFSTSRRADSPYALSLLDAYVRQLGPVTALMGATDLEPDGRGFDSGGYA